MSSKNNIWFFVLIGIVLILLISNSNFNSPKQKDTSITTINYDTNGNVVIPYTEPTIPCVLKPCSTTPFAIVTNNYLVNVLANADTYRDEYHPSTNYGSSSVLYIGQHNTADDQYSSYFGFDFSSIPSGSTINSLNLHLSYNSYTGPTTGYNVGLGWCGRTLSESTLTWDNSFSCAISTTTPLSTIINGQAISVPNYFSNLDTLFILAYPSNHNTYFRINSREGNGDYVGVAYQITSCIPETCNSLGKTCGNWSDTCSTTLNCGGAPSGYTCNTDGQLILTPTHSYVINVSNNGNVPYTNIKLTSTNPSELISYFPTTSFSLSPSQSSTIISSPIDTTNYHGQTLTAYVQANNTYTSQINNFQASILIP